MGIQISLDKDKAKYLDNNQNKRVIGGVNNLKYKDKLIFNHVHQQVHPSTVPQVPPSRQWPEVSDFVARFCTLRESNNTRPCENRTRFKNVLHKSYTSGHCLPPRFSSRAVTSTPSSRCPHSVSKPLSRCRSPPPHSSTPFSRRPHAALTQPPRRPSCNAASTLPPRYHNAAAMPPQHRSHKQLSRRLTAGSRCPQAAPTPAERFFTQPPHLQHRDTAATPQQRHPHASARRVHAALTQPSRSPHIDPCPPRPPAPPSTSPYISPPYRWNGAATPPRRCPQAAVLNPSAAHAQLHAALTPPPRHTPAGPSDKSH